jgi:hypothetical protein
MSGNSFRAAAQRCVDLSSLDSYLWGTPKNPRVSASPTENGEALHQRILNARQAIRNCPGHLKGCGILCIQLSISSDGGHLWNCEL